jgi:hypothetical protein
MEDKCWNIVIGVVVIIILLLRKWKRKDSQASEVQNNSCNIWIIISMVLSAAAFLSVLLARCCDYNTNVYYDSNSAIVGAFGVIVTLLVGWDIYKVIDINKKMDEKSSGLEREFNSYTRELKTMKKDAADNTESIINLQVGLCIMSAEFYDREAARTGEGQDKDKFLLSSTRYYLKAIELGLTNGSEELPNIRKCIIGIKEIVKQDVDTLNKNADKKLDDDTIRELINTIRSKENYTLIAPLFEANVALPILENKPS